MDANESAVILDNMGVIPCDIAYARTHPEFYEYVGFAIVNDTYIHSFRLRDPNP